MRKSIAVLGLGRFGLNLVEALSNMKVEVLALDHSEAAVLKAAEFVSHTMVCDCTDEESLKEVGVQNVDHAVVAFGENLPASLMATAILKDFGVPKITVRVDNEYYQKVIERLGATDIVTPLKMAGEKLANIVSSQNFLDFYELNGDFYVAEIGVTSPNFRKNIMEGNFRNEYDVNIILITRDGKTFTPYGSDDIITGDTVSVLGKKKNIARLEQMLTK